MAPLPEREVAELERQLGKRATLVQRGELLEEDGLRPAVEDDVVGREQHDVVVLVEPDRRRTEEQVACEVERSRGVLLEDRKSTRLNSSHSQISYAVFCLKKKKKTI